MNFKDRAKKHVTEKNLAWENFLIDCAHAGYNVKNSVANRSMFMNGYHAGKENTESLEAQLAQAEDACNQLQIAQSAAEMRWIPVSERLLLPSIEDAKQWKSEQSGAFISPELEDYVAKLMSDYAMEVLARSGYFDGRDHKGE